MKTLFGTDGMRGLAGRFPLDARTVTITGAALARHLRAALGRPPRIVIGRDTRRSGEWLERSLIDGASRENAECRSAGVITTPGVAFLTRNLPADAGVVISASHNSFEDNGIKIFAPSGRKLDDATERLIEADIFSNYQPPEAGSPAASQNEAEDLQRRYLQFLSGDIAGELDLRGLTLVVDCANGAASNLAPALFEGLGAKVIEINNRPDGENINRGCGSLHLESLTETVVTTGADVGVAFDGDADRSLFVDAQRQQADGDAVLWVLANYLQARNQLNKQIVIATVMSNVGLEIALASRGIGLVRTDVGDKYVLDELLRLDASLGGEQSGHIIFPRLSLAGDGMITTLCLLRALTDAQQPLAGLTKGFKHYPQVLLNVTVREKRPFNEIDEIRKVVEKLETALAGRGRLLLRYSGTEPLARIMIEGQNQNEIEAQAHRLAEVIQQTLGATHGSS